MEIGRKSRKNLTTNLTGLSQNIWFNIHVYTQLYTITKTLILNIYWKIIY